MEQFYGREEELIKTLSTMAKQVKGRDGPSEHDNSLSDSYRSESMDGEGEVFDDEGYYNEPFETSAKEEYYDNEPFGEGEDGEDDQFHDEGDSYGSDYSDHA